MMLSRTAQTTATLCVSIAVAMASAPAQAQEAMTGDLADHLTLCLEAVLKQDAGPFDGVETTFSLDDEEEGLPNIRRSITPATGSSEILFAISPLYTDDGTTPVGADCHVWAQPDDETATQTIDAFRAEVAQEHGPFGPVPYEIDNAIEEVACVNGRALRIIVDERGSSEPRAYLSIWDSTREGIAC